LRLKTKILNRREPCLKLAIVCFIKKLDTLAKLLAMDIRYLIVYLPTIKVRVGRDTGFSQKVCRRFIFGVDAERRVTSAYSRLSIEF